MTPVPTTEQTVIDLRATAVALLEEARQAKAGRAGHTLVPGGGAPLKQVLLAITSGSVLADHESPGTATVHVLVGSVRLTTADSDLHLRTGEFTTIPSVRHGVEALDDAVLLLTVAPGARPAA